MKSIIYTTFLILFCLQLSGQNYISSNPDYIKNVELGESALKGEKYDSCLIYYKDAFNIKQTSVLSTLRMAACAFSYNDKDEYEKQLRNAMTIDWGVAPNVLINYPEFAYLRDTPFAEKIQAIYQDSAKVAGLDLKLTDEFAIIAETDQTQRREMGPISEKYGWDSPQMDSLWTIQNYNDSINTVRISEIIDSIGYPGKSVVGPQYMGTAFLVIQHADIEVQQKYLPIVRDAADAGEVRWSSVALLIDRINLRTGKKQIYGSQVNRDPETNEHFFSPIEQPYKVDSLRASVGLGPLTEYAANWDFTYDPDIHVERYAEAETEKKE